MGQRAVSLAFVVAILLASGGCQYGSLFGIGKAPATSKAKAVAVTVEDGKRTVLEATAIHDGGTFFTRPPYDLNGAWRTELTCGVIDAKALPAATGTLFGLEVDLRGTTPLPTEYYQLFARRTVTPSAGLQLSAFSFRPGPPVGQTFFADATVLDLAIESDGATLSYYARDAAAAGPYALVGQTALGTPAGAHQAAFGMFTAKKGSKIGFTNFRIPSNGAAATAPPANQAALNSCYQAAFLVLEAAYAVDGPTVDAAAVTASDGFVVQALAALDTARQQIEALPAAKATPRDRALAAVAKAQKALDKAHALFGTKSVKEAGPFLNSVATKMFAAAMTATDALIPDELREALPGGHL